MTPDLLATNYAAGPDPLFVTLKAMGLLVSPTRVSTLTRGLPHERIEEHERCMRSHGIMIRSGSVGACADDLSIIRGV